MGKGLNNSTQSDYEWIVQNGFGGVFTKYLANADPAVVGRFFSEFSQVDGSELLKHKKIRKALLDDGLLAGSPSARQKNLVPVDIITIASQARSAGRDLEAGDGALRSGTIGALAFAGGSATRFKDGLSAVAGALPRIPERMFTGMDAGAPKGCFPIGPVEGLSFFDTFAAMMLETGIRHKTLPAGLLMTSAVTEAGTRSWLARAGLWGLPKEALTVFVQGRNPRLDPDMDLVVAKDGSLVWAGDGHGGVYSALLKGGDGSLASNLQSSGIRHLVMFNIDNPASRPFSPNRLGRHVRSGASFTISTVSRLSWDEPIGVPCFDAKSGVMEIVEYNVIDEAQAKKVDADGRLLFSAGNINVNIVDMTALRSDLEPTIYENKAVTVDGQKRLTSSIEYLNQHITRKLKPADVEFFEVERDGFFMPTKNPIGPDSAVTTFHMLSRLFGNMLSDAGAKVAPGNGDEAGAYVELHPCVAMESGDCVRNGVGKGWTIGRGSRLYLCAVYAPDGKKGFAGKDVTICDGASLLIRTERPYGNPAYDSARRTIKPEPQSAGKVFIGNGTKVLENVKVDITVSGDGECIIENGRVFDRSITVSVKPGQKVML